LRGEDFFQRGWILVNGGQAEACFDRLQFGEYLPQARISVQRGLERGLRHLQFWLLGQVADADAAGADDVAARFGVVFAGDEFEQRRFARAVGANQADALVVLDFPTQVAEDGFCAEDEAGVGEADLVHGGGPFG
jgi:hypothetical protein